MYISADILKNSLKENIVSAAILPESEMSLNYCELYDPESCDFQKNCVYLCLTDELPPGKKLPDGVTLLCAQGEREPQAAEYAHINLLVTGGITFRQLFNRVMGVFKEYQSLDECFDGLISSDVPLQEIIDLATGIVKMPLCMLDLNHNVLAISSEMESPDDALWDAMRSGYGYAHYDVVERSEPKLKNMVQPSASSVEMISNISGHYIKVTTLFRGNRAVAFLGMHRIYEFTAPFERHTVQLYYYVINKITRHLSLFSDVKVGRGMMYEQFLIDVLDEKIKDEKEIEEYSRRLGLERHGKYQAAVISFWEGVVRTDYHFAMMDYIEIILPGSKCIMLDNMIFVIWAMTDTNYLDDALSGKLSTFLKTHDCFGLLSPVFLGLSQLSGVFKLLKDVLPFVDKRAKQGNIYHYYEYTELYCMKLFVENVPFNTIRHPMIQKLIDYDKDFNTDYLDTLKIYLRNNCNISEAAKLLHMHRNSLLYRIKRIEELLGSDLAAWEIRNQLFFSMAYMEYIAAYRTK